MNTLEIKHDLTGFWTCPQCTYQRTPEKVARCGVCSSVRPGFEAKAQEEEELEAKRSKKVRLGVDARKTSARLILMIGGSLANMIELTRSKLSTVTSVEAFKVQGTVDEIRATRDNILKALMRGTSCLVYDAVFSKERQAAWLTIAKRINVPCDVVLADGADLQPGFTTKYSPSNYIQPLMELYSQKPNTAISAAPEKSDAPGAKPVPPSVQSSSVSTPVSSKNYTQSTKVASMSSSVTSMTSAPVPSMRSDTQSTKVASLPAAKPVVTTSLPVKPKASAKMVVDLTLDSDED